MFVRHLLGHVTQINEDVLIYQKILRKWDML